MRVDPLPQHPGCYRVVNERGVTYWVNLSGDGQVCDCEAGCFSDHPVPCRHVKEVLRWRRETAARARLLARAEPQAGRDTE